MEYIIYIVLFIIIFSIIYRRHKIEDVFYKNKRVQKIRRENFIIEYLTYHPEISSEEIREMFHVSEKTALNYLHSLEEVGFIKKSRQEGGKIFYSLNK